MTLQCSALCSDYTVQWNSQNVCNTMIKRNPRGQSCGHCSTALSTRPVCTQRWIAMVLYLWKSFNTRDCLCLSVGQVSSWWWLKNDENSKLTKMKTERTVRTCRSQPICLPAGEDMITLLVAKMMRKVLLMMATKMLSRGSGHKVTNMGNFAFSLIGEGVRALSTSLGKLNQKIYQSSSEKVLEKIWPCNKQVGAQEGRAVSAPVAGG